jgi:hypothetical protein
MLSVNGSSRRPCPALRMMAFIGRVMLVFVIDTLILKHVYTFKMPKQSETGTKNGDAAL